MVIKNYPQPAKGETARRTGVSPVQNLRHPPVGQASRLSKTCAIPPARFRTTLSRHFVIKITKKWKLSG